MSENIKKLAIRLHATFCHDNHDDQCSWFYEDNYGYNDLSIWNREAHKRWLDKAIEFNECCKINGISTDTQNQLIDAFRNIVKRH